MRCLLPWHCAMWVEKKPVVFQRGAWIVYQFVIALCGFRMGRSFCREGSSVAVCLTRQRMSIRDDGLCELSAHY